MIDFDKGLALHDHPEILYRIFFPRREIAENSEKPKAMNRFVAVDKGVSICCRFYPSSSDSPNIIFFHGNGETAPDYDYVAPVYSQCGLNLYVTDYRGYGMSDGSPTCTAMIKDTHPIFHDFKEFLKEQGFNGGIFVMGRSLGSAPAIEIAYNYEKELNGLIIESGFASARNQLARIGALHLFKDIENPIGFGNDLKIKDVTIPTLIIHGQWDEIIPATEGKKLYELSGAARKYSLFIPEAGHNDIMMIGLNEYMEAIESLIQNA